MAQRYETAYFALYNKSDKFIQGEMDKAKADKSYTNRHVENFTKQVIADAEHETE